MVVCVGWAQKKDVYRRGGKVRRCCLGDRIYSISCRSSYFAPGCYKEKDEMHQDDMKKRIINSFYSSNRSCEK